MNLLSWMFSYCDNTRRLLEKFSLLSIFRYLLNWKKSYQISENLKILRDLLSIKQTSILVFGYNHHNKKQTILSHCWCCLFILRRSIVIFHLNSVDNRHLVESSSVVCLFVHGSPVNYTVKWFSRHVTSSHLLKYKTHVFYVTSSSIRCHFVHLLFFFWVFQRSPLVNLFICFLNPYYLDCLLVFV